MGPARRRDSASPTATPSSATGSRPRCSTSRERRSTRPPPRRRSSCSAPTSRRSCRVLYLRLRHAAEQRTSRILELTPTATGLTPLRLAQRRASSPARAAAAAAALADADVAGPAPVRTGRHRRRPGQPGRVARQSAMRARCTPCSSPCTRRQGAAGAAAGQRRRRAPARSAPAADGSRRDRDPAGGRRRQDRRARAARRRPALRLPRCRPRPQGDRRRARRSSPSTRSSPTRRRRPTSCSPPRRSARSPARRPTSRVGSTTRRPAGHAARNRPGRLDDRRRTGRPPRPGRARRRARSSRRRDHRRDRRTGAGVRRRDPAGARRQPATASLAVRPGRDRSPASTLAVPERNSYDYRLVVQPQAVRPGGRHGARRRRSHRWPAVGGARATRSTSTASASPTGTDVQLIGASRRRVVLPLVADAGVPRGTRAGAVQPAGARRSPTHRRHRAAIDVRIERL